MEQESIEHRLQTLEYKVEEVVVFITKLKAQLTQENIQREQRVRELTNLYLNDSE